MTAAVALTMNGPNAMRLFLVAAPAAISAAPAAAVSTNGGNQPGRERPRAEPAEEHAQHPGQLHVPPAQARRVQAGKHEVEPARQHGTEHGMGQQPRPARDAGGRGPEQRGPGRVGAEGEHVGQPAVPGVDEPERD